MKKLLLITLISFVWCNVSKANEIHLVCVNTNNPDLVGSISIYENNKMISFNGGPLGFYFLENGIFKYTLRSADEKLKFRHSLNRNTGLLSVKTYELTDEQNEIHLEEIVKKMIEAGELGNRNYLAKISHQDLTRYKSTFDAFFNCDTAKSKF